MNAYVKFEQKLKDEINNFPIFFAFSDEQFEEALAKLGLTLEEKDQVTHTDLCGFVRLTDLEAYNEMFKRHEKGLQEEIDADNDGSNFVKDMFKYELNNHEYTITGDLLDALVALGFTYDEVVNNEKLLNGLQLAIKEAREEDNE